MEWRTCIANNKDYFEFLVSLIHIVEQSISKPHVYFNEGKDTVVVELQVPTGLMKMDGNIHNPWIAVFRAKDMQDCDTANQIDNLLYEGEITFTDTKELMLQEKIFDKEREIPLRCLFFFGEFFHIPFV